MRISELPVEYPLLGVLLILTVSLLGGVAVGTGVFAISFVIYLVLLFPFGVGILNGLLLTRAIYYGRIINLELVCLASILMGIITYGTLHYERYLLFRHREMQFITKELEIDRPDAVNNLINSFLKQETGAVGFWGYLQYEAQQGVAISSFFRDPTKVDRRATTFKSSSAWLYWFIELGIVVGATMMLAVSKARERFCLFCRNWYEGRHLGSVDYLLQEEFLDLIKSHNFKQANSFLEQDSTSIPSLEVYMQRCPTCERNPYILTISKSLIDKDGKMFLNELLKEEISATEYNVLSLAN